MYDYGEIYNPYSPWDRPFQQEQLVQPPPQEQPPPPPPQAPWTPADDHTLQQLNMGVSNVQKDLYSANISQETHDEAMARLEPMRQALLERKQAEEEKQQAQLAQQAAHAAAQAEAITQQNSHFRADNFLQTVRSFVDPISGAVNHFFQSEPGKWTEMTPPAAPEAQQSPDFLGGLPGLGASMALGGAPEERPPGAVGEGTAEAPYMSPQTQALLAGRRPMPPAADQAAPPQQAPQEQPLMTPERLAHLYQLAVQVQGRPPQFSSQGGYLMHERMDPSLLPLMQAQQSQWQHGVNQTFHMLLNQAMQHDERRLAASDMMSRQNMALTERERMALAAQEHKDFSERLDRAYDTYHKDLIQEKKDWMKEGQYQKDAVMPDYLKNEQAIHDMAMARARAKIASVYGTPKSAQGAAPSGQQQGAQQVPEQVQKRLEAADRGQVDRLEALKKEIGFSGGQVNYEAASHEQLNEMYKLLNRPEQVGVRPETAKQVQDNIAGIMRRPKAKPEKPFGTRFSDEVKQSWSDSYLKSFLEKFSRLRPPGG